MNIKLELDDLITPKFELALERALEKVLSKLQSQLGSAQPDKLLLSTADASKALSICEKSLFNYSIPRGTLPKIKIGSRVMYSPADLQSWIDEQKSGGQEAGDGVTQQ